MLEVSLFVLLGNLLLCIRAQAKTRVSSRPTVAAEWQSTGAVDCIKVRLINLQATEGPWAPPRVRVALDPELVTKLIQLHEGLSQDDLANLFIFKLIVTVELHATKTAYLPVYNRMSKVLPCAKHAEFMSTLQPDHLALVILLVAYFASEPDILVIIRTFAAEIINLDGRTDAAPSFRRDSLEVWLVFEREVIQGASGRWSGFAPLWVVGLLSFSTDAALLPL